MYWEFKVKVEKEKPFAKDLILFRVRTFLTWSERVEGKVKKTRQYVGTIKIYNDEQKRQADIWRVLSHVSQVFSMGECSPESIGEFIRKGETKLWKRLEEAKQKYLAEEEEKAVKLFMGEMLKNTMEGMDPMKPPTKPQQPPKEQPPSNEDQIKKHFSTLDILTAELRNATALPYEQEDRSDRIQAARIAIEDQYKSMTEEGLFSTAKEAKTAYKKMVSSRKSS